MAVAVKTSDARSQGTSSSVQVLSLIGLVYLLVCLVAVFWVIPTYLPQVFSSSGITLAPYMQAAVSGAIMIVAAIALALIGSRFVSTGVLGVRAGIFTTFVGFLVILLVSAWFGGIMEWATFVQGWFGSAGRVVGMAVTAAFAVVLVVLFLRWFFARGTDKWLEGFEEGGWFAWSSYKPQQGVRVRRGTVIGLLLLGGSGVYTLLAGNILAKYTDWSVGVPFTSTLTLRLPDEVERKKGETGPLGDAGPLFQKKLGWEGEYDQKLGHWVGPEIVTDRWFVRDEINAALDPARYVYLRLDPAMARDLGLENGVMLRSDYQKQVDEQREKGKVINIDEERDLRAPIPAGNPSGRKDRERLYETDSHGFVTLSYFPITLLPHVKFTLPLLLLALTLWMSWRITTYPPFADFLIATEAEMNKVSWTTRKRLFQDTIVVLVTVFLMAGFLLLVDLTCRNVLGNEWIRVIQIDHGGETQKNAGPKPW